MGLLLLALPLFAILLYFIVSTKRAFDGISVGVFFIMLIVGAILTNDVLIHKRVQYSFFGGFFYVDSLSIIVLDIILIIGFLCAIYSIGYLGEEQKHGKIDVPKIKFYYILEYFFIFTMILAVTVKNLGIMWVAIEATTLASVFLVGFYRDKEGLEAAWKYVIICSVGITIALLGIMFLHISYSGNSFLKHAGLDWLVLFENADKINTSVLRLSFVFIVIGFGTKAGLAPMHTWLPDAHSQAPSPISALLSGVLLNGSIYAIIRVLSIVNKNIGSSEFCGRILIALGVISIATAAIFIITQRDYKRLLAFSSIEHMGIIALALGVFTKASIFGAILHMINHSFTKSMLFLSAGNIFLKYDTKYIRRVKGALYFLPVSGLVMFLGVFAIAGSPPFSIFTSEFSILVSVFKKGNTVLGVVVISLLALLFMGLILSMSKMFFSSNKSTKITRGESNVYGAVVVCILLVIISIGGLYIPEEVSLLISDAQKIILGGI